MARAVVGFRIRERRRALGMTQLELARRVGVSPSYVNLIERNKRAIAGARLGQIARALGLTRDDLDGADERRMRGALLDLAEDPELGEPGMSEAACDELIARFPDWARAAARTVRALRDARARAEALGDRLAHDPALAAAVHAMLTEIAALRSTAEILADTPDLDPADRARFERNARAQSTRLSDTGAALAAYFDREVEARRPREPATDAEEALERLPGAGRAVEAAAERLRAALGAGERDLEAALRARLGEAAPAPDPLTPRAERLDALARALAAADPAPELDAPIAASGLAGEARAALAAELRLRVADALLLPGPLLAALGARTGWDVDALTRAAEGASARVFRRLATGRAHGAPPAAHVAVDASGRVLARRGALGLLPRAREIDCPFWPAHRPGGPARTLALSGGGRVVAVARARPDGLVADMLVLAPEDAAGTALAPPDAAETPAGSGCRICVCNPCAQRREPSAIPAPASAVSAPRRFENGRG